MLKNLKQFNLPEIEEKVLKFWTEGDIFNKSVKQREGGKNFVFFEGPPTANGRPAIHHVLGRAFKDIILRYKTMRGYHVPRRAGWDTHGLPVEIEIEKELGLKSKQEIEKFGIAEFNERARASVWKYKDEWEKLTTRTGLWLDFKNPYITYDNAYVESLWWTFAEIAKRKLLKKSYRVAPYCPRCQTTLSSHELAQPGAYRKTADPSVYVKFKIKGRKNEYLLVWTTTPWTLPSNVAVALNSGLTYTKYKAGDEYLWSYNAPPVNLGVEMEVVEKISGKKLIGLVYEPFYGVIASNANKKGEFYRVLAADFVETEQGTGLVHIAPAFGEDDFRLVKEKLDIEAKEIPFTVEDNGRMKSGFPGAGKFVKEADKDIIADLSKRNLLWSAGTLEHEYPFCWRCSTPLMYFARSSWFIEMSRLRNDLLKENAKINWVPEYLKEGRFGEWLKEVKDWAISRERYWGTPLPIWECESCDAVKIAGSLNDLDKYAFSGNKFFVMRHGEATHNLEETIAAGPEKGKNKSVLTERGIFDVTSAAKNIKKEKIDFIIASPYHRIKQTAEIVARVAGIKKIIYDKRIGELNCGIFNGRKIQDHKDFFGGNPLSEFTKAPPSGESLADLKKRMFGFILDINKQYAGKKILIVSHGDPLWILEGAARGMKNEDLMTLDYIQPAEFRKLELHNYPYNIKGELDVHRPFIDEIYLKCAKCEARMKRVKEVADVWFDSGAMPFAQWHYPFENQKLIDGGAQLRRARAVGLPTEASGYPADYIAEGMDQTRGWFYTLLAVAVALGRKAPYKTVVSFGLVLDKNGVKMSKSKGNVLDPWAMFAKYGADVVRWHFYTINPPGEAKRFDEADLLKVFRRFFAIIYNSYIFLETYGTRGSSQMSDGKVEEKHVLDRWLLARMNETNRVVSEKLDRFEVGEAGRELEKFIDDLSRWYIRRSRRRFQKPEPRDLEAASRVLRNALIFIAKTMAPFTPFFAEALYRTLNKELGITNNDQDSVHLRDWPELDKKMLDKDLLSAMESVRKFATLGLAERAAVGIKVRQPLQTLRIKNNESSIKHEEELLEILKDEVNVKEIVFGVKIEKEVELDTEITPQLREEGLVREFTRMVQGLRQDAGYKPGDGARLFVETTGEVLAVLNRNIALIKKETTLDSLEFKKVEKFDVEIVSEIDTIAVWVALKK